MINRQKFYEVVRSKLFIPSINQSQVNGCEAILNAWETSKLTDNRWLAYMLATAFHETARTMQPIEEYGKGHGHPYGIPDPQTGKAYYGRGLVQLTWKRNYVLLGKLLNVDLVNKPELALDPTIASNIMFEGMEHGLFTGKSLENYFNATTTDWVNARRIINGLDHASLIAGYGRSFLSAIDPLGVTTPIAAFASLPTEKAMTQINLPDVSGITSILDGYKTYITLAVGAIVVVLNHLGYQIPGVTLDPNNWITELWALVGGGAVRSAMNKAPTA